MGYANHELIGPAILYDNPGLTGGELVEKFQVTHYSVNEQDPDAPWDSYDSTSSAEADSAAGVLGLNYSDAYREFISPKMDIDGQTIYPPRMEAVIEETQDGLVVSGYRVLKQGEGIELDGDFLGEREDFEDPTPGHFTVLLDGMLFPEVYVTEVDEDGFVHFQEYYAKEDEEFYDHLEDLYRAWPQFSPEFMFDLDTSGGKFGNGIRKEGFLWKFVDGKYFLDEATFDRIPLSFYEGDLVNFGYTDLILTAEAIRQGAWKLLSRRGLEHAEAFLRDFPDSRERYERAVWDGFTSLAAKDQGMTNTELLRMRLTPTLVFDNE